MNGVLGDRVRNNNVRGGAGQAQEAPSAGHVLGGRAARGASPAAPAEGRQHFEREMQMLWDLGFHDRATNYRVLRENGGDVDRALTALGFAN